MGNKITGKEYQLSKIFSKEFNYYIPAYQRPYAWTEEETETLFDDLLDFYQTEKVDNYFLGSIVLIKDEDKPCYRWTTATYNINNTYCSHCIISHRRESKQLQKIS